MFGADIPLGEDAPIDVQTLVYKANVLISKCVGNAEYDGGRSDLEVPGSATHIDIDFRYWVPLANVTKSSVGNLTDDSELVLSPSTAAALPVLSAFTDSAMVARRWGG